MKLSLIININNKELVRNVRQIHRKLEDKTNSFSYSVYDYHVPVLNLMTFSSNDYLDDKLLDKYKSILSACFENINKFTIEFRGFSTNNMGTIAYVNGHSFDLQNIKCTILLPTLRNHEIDFIDEVKPNIPLIIGANARVLLQRLKARDKTLFLGYQKVSSIDLVISDFYNHSRLILDRYFLS